jgi:hypothetical protein
MLVEERAGTFQSGDVSEDVFPFSKLIALLSAEKR